ncbi:MAG: hypothetical protein L6R38_000621 [Xanthoria sp. 2 TBL-2021]|nr:MAG: hypothetical protein L6R38_000621 [Xanthoria sp. 2 TBL-2021]
MRLKVLYTFDHENKTNCLARWPQNIDIRTAYLDETTQIGVIELKTCIQAIVAASPELVAKLGQDYTVYAYDYSEYDTPLVGQGMLSWVLASSSVTPAAPAHQSKTIVTGRVCKNIMGLFSSNTQETLEVKLRLVPVPTCLQSEYIESMKSYRDISRVMPEGFDAQAWTNFLQANPGILQLANESRAGSPAVALNQKGGVGIEHVQRLMQQNHGAIDHSDRNPAPQSDNYSAAEAMEQLPRPLSQASSVRSAAPPKRGRGRPPKPVSELSEKSRSRRKPQPSRRASFDVGYASNDDQQEEGPGKKRAKVTKANYPESSGFAKQSELRVAASTAASVRIHQPTAVRPATRAATSLEGPPREPTPVAGLSNPSSRPLLPPRKSTLRGNPLNAEDIPYESPYPPSDIEKTVDSENNSPEGSRAESSNTPADFASSPPPYPASITALSSPRLPNVPHEMDSGFMSGAIDDLFEDDESRPLDDEDLDVAAQYMKRSKLQEPPASTTVIPQDSGIDLHSEQTGQPPILDEQALIHHQNTTLSATDRSKLNRTASSGNIAPLETFSNDTVRPSSLHRSQTWAGHQDDHPTSDMIFTQEGSGPASRIKSRARTGSGSGVKRKKAIQSKLAESVANGEMPPFCENCGAIETPTWRKAWIKIHSGTPEHVVVSDEEGGVIAWQSLQKDVNGDICLFRLIKRTLLPNDKGFTPTLLCNPCGLWLHNRKCMRPQEVWDKPQGYDGGSGGPRKGSSQSTEGKPGSLPDQSTSGEPSGNGAFFTDGSSPADAGEESEQNRDSQLSATNRPRASSVQPGGPKAECPRLDKASAAAALQRAIQSSPVRCRRTQNPEVAAKDLTPRPTRRILFPSPTQSEQRRALQSKGNNSKNFNVGSPKQKKYHQIDPADKENLPPQQEEEDGHDIDRRGPQRSVTPTSSSECRELTFKTPIRNVTPERVPPTTGDFFSSAAKALLRPQITPKRLRSGAPQILADLSPFTAQISEILSDANAVSPHGSTYDFPTLPSLNNTPGRLLRQDFDFSVFDPQDLLSTDVPMASSPPPDGWFGVYEDPVEREGNFWTDYPFPGSSPAASAEPSKTPPKLSVDARGHAVVDFSPLAKEA